ncbi:MAG: hypothetical protein HAW58_01045 [Candidatus Thioglobus sp.]|nr:hypothetical protein [Candidatus Thioglobus sp.]
MNLPKIASTHPIAFWFAIIIHLALIAGVFFSSISEREPENSKPEKLVKPSPKAITIDLEEYNLEKQRVVNIKKEEALEVKRAEKRLKVAEDKTYKEQKKINKLKAKTKKEKQAEALAEKERKSAQKKAKEAKKQEKLAQKKAKEAEKKKKLVQKKAQEAEKKFKKEQDKRDLTTEINTEEDQERKIAQEDILSELKSAYINQIAAKVRDKWNYYKGAKDSWKCDVQILQDADGAVQSVNVQACNIDNSKNAKSFKNSIERAVNKASPLPAAPDKSVFDSEIIFHFKVN